MNAIPDGGSGAIFPLFQTDFSLGTIAPGGVVIFSYELTVTLDGEGNEGMFVTLTDPSNLSASGNQIAFAQAGFDPVQDPGLHLPGDPRHRAHAVDFSGRLHRALPVHQAGRVQVGRAL
tara:strand:- start:80 stop:436 length:357 start_codon:yes stop_codon:yes gene_type:complete